MNDEPIAPASAPTEPTFTTPEPPAPQTDPVAFTPDPIYPAEKKSKFPRVLVPILGILVVAAAAFGIFWYVNYQSPETIALEAMSKILGTKTTEVSGDIIVTLPENLYGLETVQLTFDESSTVIPATATSTLTFATAADDFSIGLDGVIIDDGTIYFQAGGIVEVLDSAIPAELAPFIDLFEAELSEFDGQWYELDIIEIAAMFGASLSATDYDCTVDAIKSLGSSASLSAIIDSYKQAPFVTLEKTDKSENGAIGYTTNISDTGLSKFITHIRDNTSVFAPLQGCLGSGTNIDRDIPESLFNPAILPALTLYVTEWGHEPRALKATYQSAAFSYAATLNFTYPESIRVNTPENAKPLSTFLAPLIQKFTTISGAENAN